MNELDWELFDRYLAGEATPDERKRFEQWLAEQPDQVRFVEALRSALLGLEAEVTDAERDEMWDELARRAELPLAAPDRAPPQARRPVRFTVAEPPQARWRLGAGIAAAAVLAAGAALAGRALLTGRGQTEVAPAQVVTVPRGQQARFHLSDGTQVLLGAGSTLRYPRAFAGQSRDVTLEGEAYFTVEHDSQRPFRVRAGDLVATDLGTEFLVRAYPEAPGASVVVRSGSVAVQSLHPLGKSQPERVVKPGELGRIDSTGMPRVERADTAAYFAWTTGTLVFDGTPLREALPQLSRWYDLEFRLADSSLGSIPLSGRLGQTLTPARLDLLAGSVGLKQIRRERTVTFYRITPPAR